MLAPTAEFTAASPTFLSIEEVGQQPETHLDWLIITDDEPGILRRLTPLFREKSAAVVSVPQRDWDFGSPTWRETIQWAVDEAGISHLVLAGHSQAALDPAGDESPIATAEFSDGPSGRLFQGARRVQDQMRRAKTHFADQVSAFRALPFGSQRKQPLQLHSLFFVAQTRVFLHFDLESQEFRPLAA